MSTEHTPSGTEHTPTGTSYPPAGTAPSPTNPDPWRAPARRTPWLALGSTATAAALIASLVTAGLTGSLTAASSSDPTSAGQETAAVQEESVTVPVSSSTAVQPDWAAVAEAVRDSVVAIEVRTASGNGQGSGVVLDESGHVLTNHHVVDGALDDGIQVTLADGRVLAASLAGTDPTTDLAVLALDDPPEDLTPAVLGDSESVTVGAAVMAVGNPLGLDSTVTTGVVSALDRPVTTATSSSSEPVVTNAIQVDAAINPGNSGGPLFDAQGRVIGITSSIATLSGGSASGSIGLGFAIPVDLARRVAAELVSEGAASHAFLGVGLSDTTATAAGVTRLGAGVAEVTDGSPAAAAGLQAGDVVVAVDGDAVSGAESLTAYVREHAAGDVVVLTVVRDGQQREVEVTLAVRAEVAGAGATEEDTSRLPGPRR